MKAIRLLFASLALLLVCGTVQAQYSWSGTQNLADGQNITQNITLTGNVTINVASGTATINGSISGAFVVTKTGAGTLVLAGGNTYSGGTTISGGTLQIGAGAGGTLPSGATTIASGCYLAFNNSGEVLVNSSISGAGRLNKTGTGTVILRGNNTYAGLTTVSQGTLQVGGGGTVGSLTSSAYVGPGATLTFSRSDDYTYSGVISGVGNVEHNGAGTLTLTGENTYTGKTTVTSGFLNIPSGVSILNTSEIALTASSSEIVFRNTTNSTYSMPITGLGNVQKAAGAGTLTLTQPQYTGNTAILAGTVTFQTTTLPTKEIDFSSSANNPWVCFEVPANQTLEYTGLIKSSGSVSKDGAGTLRLNNTGNTYTGRTYIYTGTLQAVNSSINSTSDVLFNGSNRHLIFDITASTTFGKVISGSGTVTKRGSQPLFFTAANTYTGVTTIEAGFLVLGNGTAAGSMESTSIVNNGGLGFNRTTSYTCSAVISGTGNVTKASTGTIILNAVNTYTGYTSVSAGTLALGASGTIERSSYVILDSDASKFDISAGSATERKIKSLRGSYNSAEVIVGSKQLWVTEEGANTYAGKITGTGGLSKFGAGTLKLSGTISTYTGITHVGAGTLEFSSMSLTAGSLGANGPIVLDGGTLKWASGSTSDISSRISAIRSGGGTFDVGSGTVQFQTSFPTSAASADKAGAVTKTGAGQLHYFQPALYTDRTTISEGTLDIAGTAGSIASSQIEIAAGATLLCSRSTAYTYPYRISGGGNLRNTNAQLTLTASNTYTGTTTADFDIQIGNGDISGTIESNVTVASGRQIIFDRSNAYTYGGIISGAGKVVKNGAGTLTLSGANTYTGATEINTGTLALDATGTIAASSGVTILGADGKFTVAAGKTIKGLAGAQSGSQVTVSSGILMIDRGALSTDQTFAGVIQGAGGLSQRANAGYLWTLTLSNACTYTGATTIESGTLKLDAGGSIANSASVNLGRVGTAYYGKLDVSAGNKTIKGLSADYADNEVILGATILQIGTSAVTADGGGDFKGKFTGTGGVAKAGLQSLSLSGASTATGTFSHATGTVALAGSWAGNYYQAASTTLDVIGNATIGGTLTLAGGGNINMNLTAMPPAKINVAGSVSASGTTAVNVTATAGNYTLIQAASGLGNAGNFSFNQPGFTLTPTATGTQLNLTVAVTDVTPPTVGVAPAAGTVTAENIPLTWGAATDNQTTAANLRYFVYQSAGNNLSTVANCEANGTLLNAGGTLNLTSYNVTGLTPNTTYYFNVVVSDQAGNKAAYTATSVTTQNAAPPTDMIYQGIQPLPAINAPYNAPKTVAGLGLPQAVTISTDQGNVVGVAITWNVAATNYIMGAESEQTFTVSGTIALPAGVVNPNGLSLTTQVTVTVAARSLNPQVTAVTVTPATANIRKGQGQQFYANVTVVDGADQSVTWTVSGQSVAGTMISSAGYLTVDAGESATSLTVKAQSVFDPNKSGEATVTVDNISNNNNPVIPGLNVYPNPCAEYITIAGAANADLQIIDLSGKIRSMQKIHSDVETIKVGTLARGIYFFRLAKEGKTAVVKIIIN